MRSGLEAKNKIIEVAGEIFADRGFRETTVREICRRASVNLAAINYHFGDKERLYLAVLKHYRDIAFQTFLRSDLTVHANDPPEIQLSEFIKSFIFHILGEGQPSCFGKLMAREYIEPTTAMDIIIEEEIRPFFSRLNAIVRQLLGEQVSEDKATLCSMSVFGQCLYFWYSRSVIRRLLYKEDYSEADIKQIAEHITRFSLEAFSGLSR
jgi:TetR/AcrR family transcriptional regulator, regulator of cefoperazone and chloramphenicol sensitivity